MQSDPKIIGPGVWLSIHMLGKNATNDERKKEFMNFMYLLYDEFPCANCRNHIQEYMNTHPFQPFLNITDNNGSEIGMFRWSWLFHNTVNNRLHKPFLDWETAIEMYNINEGLIKPCTTCGGNEDSSPSLPALSIDKNKIVQGYFLKKGISKTLHNY